MASKKKLFQYAVILHKTQKIDGGKIGGLTASSSEEYVDSELIIEPTFLMAKSEKDVIFKVTRLIPESSAENPDNVEILVRNF